ncbi:hypothetical protein BJ980_000300 [Nocardioides daedukensis]|uniref:DUF6318 domain-containing protein n=1 Tax=Nocardioides daedukensis TaxID=634462 RepID=A0A7Y9RZ16_9ACTN|nr:DUF6318 family protein [Nocardioides daedukensis]NYG57377.1 hypothetical protein [Nocardioides daedukensis]
MIHVRRRLVSLVCLPLVLFSACGDGDSDADEPSTPSPSSSQLASPSTFPSPSESASTLPEDLPADEVDPEEIVEAWVEAYDEATTSGDTNRLRTLSAKSCTTCDNVAMSIEKVYSSGGWIKQSGGATQVQTTTVRPGPNKKKRMVTAQLAFTKGTTKQDSSSQAEVFAAADYEWDFYLAVVSGRWQVTDIGI